MGVVKQRSLRSNFEINVEPSAVSALSYERAFEDPLLAEIGFAIASELQSETSAGGLLSLPLLSGAYFATDRLEFSGDLAVVTEILPAVGNLLTKTASFPIKHFSGYILASGRSGGDEIEGY